MKLRTIRRSLQTRLESRWMQLRSRFVDVAKLAEEVAADLSIGVVVLDDPAETPNPRTNASIDSQLYRNYSVFSASPSEAVNLLQSTSKVCDYLAIVDPGVVLGSGALLWATVELKKLQSRPDWIYFDHVEFKPEHRLGIVGQDGTRRLASGVQSVDVDHDGRSLVPVFKPEFSPEYLLTGMFAGGFSVFSSACIEKVLAASEDVIDSNCLQYEIALRTSEQPGKAQVVRVPQIAFSRTLSVTSDQVDSQHQAVERHLRRRGAIASVEVACCDPVVLSPRFEAKIVPDVTILIPTRNQCERVRKCVDGVRATTESNIQIRMIDNQSDQQELFDYYETQKSLGRFDVESFDEPFNYARMHNLAIDKVDSEFVLLLNNDVLDFSDGWVEQLVATARLSEDIGCVGGLLRYPDGMTQHGGVSFGVGRPCRHIHLGVPADAAGYCGRLQAMQQLSALTAALLLVRRSVYVALGGFDEKRYPISYNDTDLCLKMRTAGYRSIYNPRVTAVHEESVSRGKSPMEKKWRADFIQQWAGEIESDPFYNPHLSKRQYAVDQAAFRVWQDRKLVSLETAVRAA